MKRASITDAKNGLSALIDRVRRGERVIIEDRGIPVARLESVIDLPLDDEGRVAVSSGGARAPARRRGAEIRAEDFPAETRQAGTPQPRRARRTGGRTVIFWDSSAVVPLLAEEPATAAVARAYSEQLPVVWWATSVECGSAIACRERDGHLTSAQAGMAFDRLDALRAGWVEVEPGIALDLGPCVPGLAATRRAPKWPAACENGAHAAASRRPAPRAVRRRPHARGTRAAARARGRARAHR